MIEIELSKIKVDESRNEQLIVFREKDGTRFLPLVIGIPEIQSIKMKLSGIEPPRPLTHDLFVSTLKTLGASLEKVVIEKLKAGTFYAKLILKTREGGVLDIDARPSDSVAIALRAGAPIFVSEEVLGQAAVSSV